MDTIILSQKSLNLPVVSKSTGAVLGNSFVPIFEKDSLKLSYLVVPIQDTSANGDTEQMQKLLCFSDIISYDRVNALTVEENDDNAWPENLSPDVYAEIIGKGTYSETGLPMGTIYAVELIAETGELNRFITRLNEEERMYPKEQLTFFADSIILKESKNMVNQDMDLKAAYEPDLRSPSPMMGMDSENASSMLGQADRKSLADNWELEKKKHHSDDGSNEDVYRGENLFSEKSNAMLNTGYVAEDEPLLSIQSTETTDNITNPMPQEQVSAMSENNLPVREQVHIVPDVSCLSDPLYKAYSSLEWVEKINRIEGYLTNLMERYYSDNASADSSHSKIPDIDVDTENLFHENAFSVAESSLETNVLRNPIAQTEAENASSTRINLGDDVLGFMEDEQKFAFTSAESEKIGSTQSEEKKPAMKKNIGVFWKTSITQMLAMSLFMGTYVALMTLHIV